jgi:predicted transcriptional regulator of viral defense system
MQHLVLSMAKKTQEKQILKIICKANALRARDAEDQHIPRAVLSHMVSAGQLQRSSRGVYTLPEGAISEYRALVDVAIRIPSAVICLLTALRYYQIGTQSPSEVWVAPRATQPASRLDHPRKRVSRA